MSAALRIGTRDSQLAVWQASWVQQLLKQNGIASELVYIKSEGDIDTVTPLYALGVQGVFTKALDAAMLSGRIDLAVHSMKDVPTQLAQGIRQAAVLRRASTKDILVYKNIEDLERLGYNGRWNAAHGKDAGQTFTVATSSVRRIAQWLQRYPTHRIENLRGNVNTRLGKLASHDWNGAIFAAAGLERINLRPDTSIELDWMLPAPAQGAVMVVCREDNPNAFDICQPLNDDLTVICTRIERDFLSTLMGGCSTPVSALAEEINGKIRFRGNIVQPDGSRMAFIEKVEEKYNAHGLGIQAAGEILENGGRAIAESIKSTGPAT